MSVPVSVGIFGWSLKFSRSLRPFGSVAALGSLVSFGSLASLGSVASLESLGFPGQRSGSAMEMPWQKAGHPFIHT